VKTRKGVEIARTGTFELSSGEHEFTKEQLASAIKNAANGFAPVIGIGHTDPRWNVAAGDGEPALGRIENLSLADDGELLLGDLVDMPDWFADALPTAFPRRSLEGAVENGELTINALKVLGTKRPGIHTLADIKDLVSDEGPALVTAGADNDGHEFTVILDADPTTEIRASANIEELREAWQTEHPNKYDDENPSDWWCIDEIQVDPDQLIYRHEDKTWRQDWSVSSDGEFTFGDPVEVTKQYVDKVAASGPAAVYKPPAEGGHPSNETEVLVDPKKIREALGLPEDATDEQVAAKLAEQEGLKLQAVPDEEETPAGEGAGEEDEEGAPAGESEEEGAAELPDGTVAIDKDTLEELKVAASRADTLFEKDRVTQRDAMLDKAQGEGRFPRSRREHYAKAFDTDPEGTKKLLTASAAEGGLAPGIVPVDKARGATHVEASAGESDLLTATRKALRIPTTTEA
jgi:hypothetical protein